MPKFPAACLGDPEPEATLGGPDQHMASAHELSTGPKSRQPE